MSDLFPEQSGGHVGCGPILGAMALLSFLVCIFMLMQKGSAFDTFWTAIVFVYEVIDELWEA